MRAWLLSMALPLVLMAPTFAQQIDSQQQTPGQQVQQQTAASPPGPVQPRMRQNPQAAGLADGRSTPGFLLVRAKDPDGNTVVMLVNPDTGEAIPLGTANQRQQQMQPQQQQAVQQQMQPQQQQALQQQQQQALQQQMQQALLQQQHGPQKTIGHPKTEVVPSLLVFNARGASLQGGKLALTGVSPNTIVFADRPARAAGHDLTAHVIENWGKGAQNFATDPPNATVSGISKDGGNIRDAVVVLKTPKLEGDQLTFDVDVIEGDLTGADGPAAVFIDDISYPLAARRGAWYARAGTYGASAAPANPYAYTPYSGVCGPNSPC